MKNANSILEAKDDYEVLGLSRGATIKEVMSAFRKLILIYYPDRAANEEEREIKKQVSQKIITAKENLTRSANKEPLQTLHATFPMAEYKNFTDLYHAYLEHAHMKLALTGLSRAVSRANTIVGQVTGNANPSSSTAMVSSEETDLGMQMAICKMLLDVWHGEDIFCLGMTLTWIKSIIEDTESIFLKNLQTGFNSKTVLDLYEFASIIHPLVSHPQIQKLIKERAISQCFDEISEDKDSFMSTPVNLGWSFNFIELKEMLVKQLKLSPYIPFLIYDRLSENSHYIGALFDEKSNSYKLFSPYEPDFSCLSENAFTDALKNHFFPEDLGLKKSIAISNFAPMPIEFKFTPQAHELITRKAANSELIMKEENFMAHILSHYTPHSRADAHFVLSAIRDNHLTGFLKEIYVNAPEYFTQDLLCEFLNEAIARNNEYFPIEICLFSDEKSVRSFYVHYYINQFLNNAKEFGKLEMIILSFSKQDINLKHYVDDVNQNNNTFFDKHCSDFISHASHLSAVVSLGVVPSQDQISALLTDISSTLQEKYRTIKNSPLEYKKSEAEKVTSSLMSVLKVLYAANIFFYQADGLPPKSYIAYGLIFSGLEDFFKLLLVENRIGKNYRDIQGKYILNHCSREENWPMVKFLSEQSAMYATGNHISYKDIPALHAWINHVDELSFLYTNLTPNFWSELVVKQLSLYEVLLKTTKTDPAILSTLRNMFEHSIKNHFLRYAFSAGRNFNELKHIIKISGIKQSLAITTIKPLAFNASQYYDLNVISPLQNFTSCNQVPTIIGMTESDAQTVIRKIFNGPITRLHSKKGSDVFYCCDVTLQNDLIRLMMPDFISQYIMELKQQIKHSSENLDLGEIITRVTELLFDVENIFNAGLQDNHFDYLRMDNTYTKEKYKNNWESLFTLHNPRAVALTFDQKGKVKAFYCIPHASILHLRIGADPLEISQQSDLALQVQHKIEKLLWRAHTLKPILEKSTSLQYSASPPPTALPSFYQFWIADQHKRWNDEAATESKPAPGPF